MSSLLLNNTPYAGRCVAGDVDSDGDQDLIYAIGSDLALSALLNAGREAT